MRRALSLFFFVALAPGCLVVEAPSNHEMPIEADDFCTRLAQVECDGFDHCCDDATVRMHAPTHDACVQMVQHQCTDGSFNISVAVHDRRTGYDPYYGGAVIETMRDYVSRCDPEIVRFTNRRDGLESALRGTVANGAACLDGQDITMNFAALLSCEDFSSACILRDGMHGECAMRRSSGDTCFLDFDCREDLYCTGLIGGHCQARLPIGGDCQAPLSTTQQHTWCESSYCVGGHCAMPTRTNVYCGSSTIPTMM
jgi:hypothetical protein